MAQLVEHILGKDEVPGPNPGSSSRRPRSESFGALAFYRGIQLSGAATRYGSGMVTVILRKPLNQKSPQDYYKTTKRGNRKGCLFLLVDHQGLEPWTDRL